MMLLSQIPDPTHVLDKAVGVSWEAGGLAMMMIAAVVGLCAIGRAWMNQAVAREGRMAARIDELQNEVKELSKEQLKVTRELLTVTTQALNDNTTAMRDLSTTLKGRACLWEKDKVSKFVSTGDRGNP